MILSKQLFATVAATLVACTPPCIFAQAQRPPVPLDALRMFADTIGLLASNHAIQVSSEKLIELAVRGMLREFDPHAEFYDKEAFAELRNGPSAAQGNASVGLELRVSGVEAEIQVVAPIEGSPAARGGILPGDVIEKVGDTSLKGMTLASATRLLRGQAESMLSLTVRRRGESKSRPVSLRREIGRIVPVQITRPERDIAYVRIRQFQESTPQFLVRQLEALSKDNGRPFSGLILDLRSNPGGLFLTSVLVGAAFLPGNQTVTRTQGRTAEDNRNYQAAADDYLKPELADLRQQLAERIGSAAVVALIDRGTAAGSEVVAAALKDNNRAILLGERTAGRGSLQTIFPISNGAAVKMTTAIMLRPAGQSLESQGVAPDEVIDQDIFAGEFGSEIDRVYLRGIEILRKQLRP